MAGRIRVGHHVLPVPPRGYVTVSNSYSLVTHSPVHSLQSIFFFVLRLAMDSKSISE